MQGLRGTAPTKRSCYGHTESHNVRRDGGGERGGIGNLEFVREPCAIRKIWRMASNTTRSPLARPGSSSASAIVSSSSSIVVRRSNEISARPSGSGTRSTPGRPGICTKKKIVGGVRASGTSIKKMSGLRLPHTWRPMRHPRGYVCAAGRGAGRAAKAEIGSRARSDQQP